jgi:Tol biopolymer transport system component
MIAIRGAAALLALLVAGCTGAEPPPPSPTASPAAPTASPTTEPVDSREPVVLGEPIDVATLTGRIVLSSDDDVYTANADGTGAFRVTHKEGPEFDAAFSPDGRRIVYRDSLRGYNEDDEVFVVRADGSRARSVSRDPANDWGPAWSPGGETIAFNSTRDGLPMGGYLVDPDGSNLRRIPTEMWVEYPSWSPDGERIAFMGGPGGPGEYDIWTIGVDGSDPVQLTDAIGSDGWPAWSPDGTRIAFTSVRDDCSVSDEPDCRTTREPDDLHRDVWIVNADGTGLRRVTLESGQFVAWSPDGEYLLVSGYDLYVIRPDGTGRTSLEVRGVPGREGVFPDWSAG